MPRTTHLVFLLKCLGFSLGLVLLDQCSKIWAIQHLTGDKTPVIGSPLLLNVCYNKGIGFSLFAHAEYLVYFMTGISILSIVYELLHLKQDSFACPKTIGLACLLGGGVSNGYDRFNIGAVIDFISIDCFFWKTPTFNVADLFIIVGFCLIIITTFSQRS